MQHTKPVPSHLNRILCYFIIQQECDFSFHTIYYSCFMATPNQSYMYVYIGNVIEGKLSKITEPRKNS